jgi:type I restriction enzyme S subunit
MNTIKLTKKYAIYPEYKDSGIVWVAKIPKDWNLKKVKHIAEILPSNVDKLTVDGETSVHLCNYLDVYRNKKITADMVENLALATASKIQIKRLSLFADDVIITKDSETPDDIGIPTYVSETLPGVVCGYHLAIIRPQKIDGAYLAQFFLSRGAKMQFSMLANGLTRYSIGIGEIGSATLAIPSLEIQKKIVRFLDEKMNLIDQMIEQKHKQIELLREKRVAVINHAVTKGFHSEVELVESGTNWIGKVPNGWSIEKLKAISYMNKKSLSEKTDPSFSFKYFDIGSVNEEDVLSVDGEILFVNAPSRARRIVSVGDSIIATVRTYLKAIAYFEVLDTDTIVSTGFAVFTPKERLFPKYLFYYLQSDRFINQVIINSKGIGYPAITPFDLESLEIIFPNIKEQELLVRHLDKEVSRLNLIIDKIDKSIEFLKEFKLSLISNAVTGKIKV